MTAAHHPRRRRRPLDPHRADPGARAAPATRCARTGNAATLWRWVEDGEGDLVITDVVMPDENGLDLIPRIQRMRPGSARRGDERADRR